VVLLELMAEKVVLRVVLEVGSKERKEFGKEL
jgi:hypothetical protein